MALNNELVADREIEDSIALEVHRREGFILWLEIADAALLCFCCDSLLKRRIARQGDGIDVIFIFV